jgi:hypothetical protein
VFAATRPRVPTCRSVWRSGGCAPARMSPVIAYRIAHVPFRTPRGRPASSRPTRSASSTRRAVPAAPTPPRRCATRPARANGCIPPWIDTDEPGCRAVRRHTASADAPDREPAPPFRRPSRHRQMRNRARAPTRRVRPVVGALLAAPWSRANPPNKGGQSTSPQPASRGSNDNTPWNRGRRRADQRELKKESWSSSSCPERPSCSSSSSETRSSWERRSWWWSSMVPHSGTAPSARPSRTAPSSNRCAHRSACQSPRRRGRPPFFPRPRSDRRRRDRRSDSGENET